MWFSSDVERSTRGRELGWHEMRCPCGAEWRWYGADAEATFLKRLWARHHQPHGARIPA
jgi:hypothetical protein